jgi:5-enolpyruvylshikimate-3-phosphate synthase
MLRARGVPVERAEDGDAVVVALEGGTAVQAIDQHVPADVSGAAFWLVPPRSIPMPN